MAPGSNAAFHAERRKFGRVDADEDEKYPYIETSFPRVLFRRDQ
jgi:hypothetical protein